MRLLFVLLLLLLNVSYVQAEEKILSATGIYVMGDSNDENLFKAKESAKKDALRQISEEACTLVDSYSLVKNQILQEDITSIMSAAILEVLSEHIEMFPVDKHIEFKCYITARVDTNNVEEYLHNKSKLKKIEKENSELKSYVKQMCGSSKILTDNQKRATALADDAIKKKDFVQQINMLQQALSFDSNCLEAFYGLALIYYENKDVITAKKYIDHAIKIIKSRYSAIEIDYLVNSWYIKDTQVYGPADFTMISIYELKSLIENKDIITNTCIIKDENGKVVSDVLQQKIYTNW